VSGAAAGPGVPKRVKRLGHVCLNTADIRRVTEFYCDVLGCQVIHEFKDARGETYGVFLLVNNSTFLEFFRAAPISEAPSRFRHLCFEVEDIQEWAGRFTARGVVVDVRRGRTDRVWQFEIRDPDDNVVEFHQYDPECVQYPFLN
jgi:lactoylglutathione lyase